MTTIVLSRHAEEALVERNLPRGWILDAIAQPHCREPDPNHADRWRVFRRVDGGRIIRVVCTMRDGAILVVTAHLDRSKRYEVLLRP